MNKEIEEDDRVIKISMPLLTEKEMLEIDNNFNEIVNKIKNQFIKEKDLAIAQYIINKQQKELEQKETILDKVTDKLKEDAREEEGYIKWLDERTQEISQSKKTIIVKSDYARSILNIIEGEKNNE